MLFPELESTGPRLIGIAKLAAESPTLDQKRRIEYLHLATRRWIGRASGFNKPFEWTINPYRGCEYGCKYCYARYTHEFMELEVESFEERIFAKHFDPRAFASELRRIPPGERICIGSATDPYQPAERRYRITRQILEVAARHKGHDIGITTKSDLMTRDIDVLSEASRSNVLHVFQTITTTDAELARLLEPYAPRPDLRLATMKKLTDAGIRVCVLASPVMPLINDSVENLEGIAKAAAEAGAQYLSSQPVFLKPCAQKVFFPFLAEKYPHLLRRYRERFERDAYLRGTYPEMLAKRVDEVRRKYGLARRPGGYDLHCAVEQLEMF